jgi:hypothetical protein
MESIEQKMVSGFDKVDNKFQTLVYFLIATFIALVGVAVSIWQW